jgi:hypothetical protein
MKLFYHGTLGLSRRFEIMPKIVRPVATLPEITPVAEGLNVPDVVSSADEQGSYMIRIQSDTRCPAP